MDAAKLNAIKASIVGHGCAARWGRVFKTWGEPQRYFPNWASSARAGVSMPTYFSNIERGRIGRGLASLEEPVGLLKGAAAAAMPAGLLLVQMLGYLDEHGDWHYSRWWREADDVFQQNDPEGLQIHDYFNRELRGIFQGMFAKVNPADGTPRFEATCYDAMRWAQWLLDELNGAQRIVTADVARRIIGGGPWGNGTGTDQVNEGLQVHLVINERMWEEPDELHVPGVPDHTFMARDGGANSGTSHGTILGVPQYGITMAHRGPRDASAFLPQLCGAVLA